MTSEKTTVVGSTILSANALDALEKEEAIQNYMNYIFQTPEFQEKLRKSILHYIDTGEINA